MHKIISDFEIQHNKAFCDAVTKAKTPTEQKVGMFNDYITRIYTLERALGRAITALHEFRDVVACPPDVSYENIITILADEAIKEIDEIMEVEQCE